MKDFADIPNSSGSFPSVIAQDCSGPGETDGTAIIAETMSDYMGFIQAILDEVGDTPNDSAEAHDASQILDDLKLLPVEYTIPLCLFKEETYSAGSPHWLYGVPGFWWLSNANFGIITIPLKLVPGVEIDLQVDINVVPNVIRSGTNRMKAEIGEKAYNTGTASTLTSDYDDGTATQQDITLNVNSLTPTTNKEYHVILRAGNDGGTNLDILYGIKVTITKS